jgi:serpin B
MTPKISSIMIFATLVCFGIILQGCADQGPADEPSEGNGPRQPAVSEKEQAQTGKLVEASNQFASNLYAQLSASEDGNLFFSPSSIHTALAMTYAGARGNTGVQMARTLHYDKVEPILFHGTYGELISSIAPPKDKPLYELHTANALWLQRGEPFLNSFLNINKTNYNAGLYEVDYVSNLEGSRNSINKWVEDQTKDKIKELIKPGVLDPLSVLVLTNAVYFKGAWDSEFDEKLTEEGSFRVTTEQTVQVPMMNQTADFDYFQSEDLQAVRLPYAGMDLSMVILLPKQVDGLAWLEERLTTKNLKAWLGEMGRTKVKVSLPKFKTTSEFELKTTLQKMGMVEAFGRSADFSGINGRKDLLISNVVHQAYVDVNEEGTEATAATGVVIGRTAFVPPKIFKADRPFLFMIRHDKTGLILFLGRMANPAK